MMETAVVVGNCQAKGLEIQLARRSGFAERFEIVSFPAVHEIPDGQIPTLHEAVDGAALVFLQTVDDEYRGGIGLGNAYLASIAGSATVVRWPSVYWAGYVPDLFYLKDSSGATVVRAPFDYHDRVVLSGFARGDSVEETCVALADPERPSDALAKLELTTAELAVRSEGCDLGVSDLIAEKFRDELLFYTMNHPSNSLMSFLADEALDLLDIPSGDCSSNAGAVDLLSSTFYPLHANHVKQLGLEFGEGICADGENPFRIRGAQFSPLEAVSRFFEYYRSHRELVEINLERTDSGQDFGGTNGIA